MSCNNCYNGCAEIVSDKCVKYTGLSIPALGIETGDSLAKVEEALVDVLLDVLVGANIKPLPTGFSICTIVNKYIPVGAELTLDVIIQALIQAACDLQVQVDLINNKLNILNSPYSIGCLPGSINTSSTHEVLQATINKLCSVDSSLTALIASLPLTYVKLADINNIISAYLAGLPNANLVSNKMVPYTAVPYFGSLSFFDPTGAGSGNWTKIYLCNGNNGTPDLRGRVVVGTTVMGSGPFDNDVNPALGNPTYSLGFTTGSNSVVLNTSQMPSHTHTVTDPGHKHTINLFKNDTSGGNQANTAYLENDNGAAPTTVDTANATTGITLQAAGSGLGHPNIQPVLALHYIMYIP